MANKLSTVLANLAEALAELKEGGTIRDFGRRLINPLTVTARPALAMVLSRFHRDDTVWHGEVLFQLAADSGREVDDALIELVAAIDDAISELQESGQAGGVIDTPIWDIWVVRTNDGQYQKVGAVGGLTITVESPLLIPAA